MSGRRIKLPRSLFENPKKKRELVRKVNISLASSSGVAAAVWCHHTYPSLLYPVLVCEFRHSLSPLIASSILPNLTLPPPFFYLLCLVIVVEYACGRMAVSSFSLSRSILGI
jgi:hypothetical protein